MSRKTYYRDLDIRQYNARYSFARQAAWTAYRQRPEAVKYVQYMLLNTLREWSGYVDGYVSMQRTIAKHEEKRA